jgi:hypothetical protein
MLGKVAMIFPEIDMAVGVVSQGVVVAFGFCPE